MIWEKPGTWNYYVGTFGQPYLTYIWNASELTQLITIRSNYAVVGIYLTNYVGRVGDHAPIATDIRIGRIWIYQQLSTM